MLSFFSSEKEASDPKVKSLTSQPFLAVKLPLAGLMVSCPPTLSASLPS